MNEEEFTELTPEYCQEEYCGEDPVCEDSAEALLEKYERRRSQKTDDIFAMQAVICVLLAAALFVFNLFWPEICAPVYEKLRSAASDEREIMPNLIDVVMSKL